MTENTTQPDPDTEPAGNLESTTITHPTPTQDPAESVVSKDDDDDESTVPDLDEDHDDAGSSPDALAGAADGDDGHGS